MLNSAKQMEVVSEKPGEQLKKLRVNEGVNLFIEDKTVPFPKEQDPTQAHLNEEEAKEVSSRETPPCPKEKPNCTHADNTWS